jgi:hypothetical protein
MVILQNGVQQLRSPAKDGCHSAVALLLKAALIQVSDYRLLGASGLFSSQCLFICSSKLFLLLVKQVWTQKCAVQKASVDVNIVISDPFLYHHPPFF